MQLSTQIVGDPSEFDFRHRLLNLISFIGLALCLFIAVSSHWLIEIELTLALYTTFVLTSLGYVFSRFFRNTTIAYTLFYVVTVFGVASNYIYGAGHKETSLFWLFTATVLITLGSPKAWIKYIIAGLIAMFLILFFIDINYPNIIVSSYENDSQFYADLTISILVGLIFCGLGIYLFAKQYDKEKDEVEKKSIELKKQRDEFEKLNAEKLKLLSIISHDFKAPLDSIDSALSFYNEGIIEEKNLRQQLLAQTRNTSQLLTNLLLWSNNQIINTKPDLKPIEINKILEKVFFTYVPIADQKNILLQLCNISFTEVIGDEQLLSLCLRNLVNNAIKFSNEGAVVKIKVIKHKKHITIKIIDDGIGINILKQKEILNQKIDSTYGTHNEKGIGLGLQITMESLAKMNSKLKIISETDKGSTFYFDLPLAPPI